MADPADLARLRRLTDEPAGGSYSTEALAEIIDRLDSVEAAAAEVWQEKAATYAALVDTSEGSSSRRLSQLRENALAMAKSYSSTGGQTPTTPDPALRPRSRAIRRG